MRDKEKQKATAKKWYYKNRLEKLAKNKAWMEKNREYRKEYSRSKQLPRTYGITVEQYNVIFEAQEGCCAICKVHQSKFQKRLYVDHNHETGKVRALLCVNCNMLIGHAREDVSVLGKAINYLKEHGLQP